MSEQEEPDPFVTRAVFLIVMVLIVGFFIGWLVGVWSTRTDACWREGGTMVGNDVCVHGNEVLIRW